MLTTEETMGFWVYMLRCADNSYYIGHTDNLEYRVAQHESGEFDGYTAIRKPIQLVFTQECATREEAISAERQLKGWSRKKKEAMIRGDWIMVNQLSRGKYRDQREEKQAQPSTPLVRSLS